MQNLLIKNPKKDKVPFIQRRGPGSETVEEFRINWNDAFEDVLSGILFTKSSLGVLSSNYNRKTKTSEMWLTTLDQQTYTPIARALISDPMGPDPKNIRHRDNRRLHSDDNRYLARIAGLVPSCISS